MLKGTLITNRLLLKEAIHEECIKLKSVLHTWTDKQLVEGSGFEGEDFEKWISEGDLPPVENACKANYRLKSIYLKEENKLIGYIGLYMGYPAKDCLWIGILVIDSGYRKNGYAQEIISRISDDAGANGFSKLGIAVYLNNWRALRFWTKAGFDRVTGISCDGEYEEEKFATIKLQKEL
ncbi:MAG: GNAT family N-acetyltransferase [Bacteroidales bacterium]|nr:GNAT family N-acetyltransferase [Bacteroidales bacterium]